MTRMVLEIATFDIQAEYEDAFAAAYGEARGIISAAPGFQSARMTRGVESPSRFVLLVEWDSIDAHEDFRASDRFPQWRGLIGPHFAAPPAVEHYEDVDGG
jgi:heme-degrading monooxygenase HmoA